MSGFLVPPIFGTAATAAAGSTQNFVMPTISWDRPKAKSVSVQLGTSDTIRRGSAARSSLNPRSSTVCIHDISISGEKAAADDAHHAIRRRALSNLISGRDRSGRRDQIRTADWLGLAANLDRTRRARERILA